ncbi:metallophosphoesterase [bacterium]|nr:metallophosphoesterase [bacterium]
MKIMSAQSGMNNVNFRAAQVNILATSDNHGNVHSLPKFVKTIESNEAEIFQKGKEPSTLNIFAIAGDWFINPSKKGFITKEKMKNGDIQLRFLKKTIDCVNKLLGKESNFDTVFTMGNHDLDGGDRFIYKAITVAPMKTLVTNVDLEKSPVINGMMQKVNPNVAKSIVYEIPDDKNPDLKHKVLFVGATIPTMGFYNPGLLEKMSFYDDGNVKDSNLNEEDIQGTINAVKEEVEKFKKENPKGAVILLSHMGARLSQMIRDNVPQINVILNGHDHKYLTSLRGKTNINSLGQDNEMIKSLNLRFNDDGDLETTDMNMFFTGLTLVDDIENHPLQLFLNENFARDREPLVSVKDLGGKEVELDYGTEIRYSNSHLANYLTSAIKRSVRNSNPDVFAVAIQSSIIRGGIKDGSSNLDLMKVFDGVSEDLSNLQIGEVKGKELVGLITENILANLDAPTRNTIIHWSDIQIDRTLMSKIRSGESKKQYKDAIKVRNNITKKFEPINLSAGYKIVLPEKYLVKDDIKWPGKIRDRFVSLNQTYDELFKQYLYEIDHQIKVTPKTKEQRIL